MFPVLVFQSTPPARGATVHIRKMLNNLVISIHAPREGGDSKEQDRPQKQEISIHAPREGGDTT